MKLFLSITENIHLPLDFSGSRYCTVPQEYENLQEFLQSYGLKQLWASIFLIFLDTKCKLHVFQHQSKSSNVLCTFNIRSVSRESSVCSGKTFFIFPLLLIGICKINLNIKSLTFLELLLEQPSILYAQYIRYGVSE